MHFRARWREEVWGQSGGRTVVEVAAAAGGGLREQRDDGRARVAADNRHVDCVHIDALHLGDEGARAGDVERGDAEELGRVVDARGLERLGGDRDGRVDRVGDDGRDGARAGLGDALGQRLHDGGVGVEEVVAGHAGLARDAGRDDDDVAAVEGLVQVVRAVAHAVRVGGAVVQIDGDARSDRGDVVAGELGDLGVELEQQGHRLACDHGRGSQRGARGEGRARWRAPRRRRSGGGAPTSSQRWAYRCRRRRRARRPCSRASPPGPGPGPWRGDGEPWV